MSALFTSPGGRFAVRLDLTVVEALRVFAAAQYPFETGGALVGYYEGDKLAVVTDVLGPPTDTVHGRRTLELGVAGLDAHFAAIWPARFHVGDWHTHPGQSPPVPSNTDHATMRAHALGDGALSLILGGVPGAYAISATIYEQGEPIALAETPA